jgi:hypothetical protein
MKKSLVVMLALFGLVACGGGGDSNSPTSPPSASSAKTTLTLEYESSDLNLTAETPSYVGTFTTIFRLTSSAAAKITHTECGLQDGGSRTTLVQGKDQGPDEGNLAAGVPFRFNVVRGPVTATTLRQWTTFCEITVVDAGGSQVKRGYVPSAEYVITRSPTAGGPTPTPTPKPAPAPTPTPVYSCTNPPAQCNVGCGGKGEPACGTPTAMCDDGKWSCSTSTGTCSGHGGVACWVK